MSVYDMNAKDIRARRINGYMEEGIDKYALKEVAGHTIKDITESTYTVRDLEWLRATLNHVLNP